MSCLYVVYLIDKNFVRWKGYFNWKKRCLFGSYLWVFSDVMLGVVWYYNVIKEDGKNFI